MRKNFLTLLITQRTEYCYGFKRTEYCYGFKRIGRKAAKKKTAHTTEELLKKATKEMETSLKKDGIRIALNVVIPEERYADYYIIAAKSSMKRMDDYDVIDVVTKKLFDYTDVPLRRHVSHIRVL